MIYRGVVVIIQHFSDSVRNMDFEYLSLLISKLMNKLSIESIMDLWLAMQSRGLCHFEWCSSNISLDHCSSGMKKHSSLLHISY